MLDTYRTFGCENGQPTFRYSLLDGVKEGYLINPTVVDARTEITTQLLSEEGFIVSFTDDDGEDREEAFKQREFEKKFLRRRHQSALLQDLPGKRPARSGQRRDRQVHHLLPSARTTPPSWRRCSNEMADRMFPGKYQSDFAVQVTSQIPDAQQFTINFTNNNLLGSANFLPGYKTSKARVCVTVGMMTTGYDCPDILNLGLFRPIFSPTDFIQIKGRGTRKHNFLEQLFDDSIKEGVDAAAEDRLQALRLLRQLRILRGEVQLRRGAQAAPAASERRRRWRQAPARGCERRLRAPWARTSSPRSRKRPSASKA